MSSKEIVFTKDPRITGTMHPRSGDDGVIESRKSVSKNNIIAPPYAFAISKARSHEGDAQNNWFDTNSEFVYLRAHEDYSDTIRKGKTYGALIINASLFSNDIKRTKDLILRKGGLNKKQGLRNNSIPLNYSHKNKLFGENIVFAYKNGLHEWQNFTPFTLDTFMEAQKSDTFLKENPFYVIFLDENDLNNNARRLVSIKNAYSSQTDIVQAGKNIIWSGMLHNQIKKGYDNQRIGLITLDEDSGRVGTVSNHNGGFNFIDINYFGRSSGIAPEALDALVNLIPSLKEHISIDTIALQKMDEVYWKITSNSTQNQLNNPKYRLKMERDMIATYLKSTNE